MEIATRKGRYKMSPLEELQFCAKNQFIWEKVAAGDDDDQKYKPGMFKMVQAALRDDWSDLPSLVQQAALARTIDRIFGYDQ